MDSLKIKKFLTQTNMVYFFTLFVIFIIGVYLRCLAYSYNIAFEDDECRLLIQTFFSVNYAQSAPPLYLALLKVINAFFGFNEKMLKLPSLIFSLGSMFMFYKISTQIFEKKYSIILANFLFAINMFILYFATVIKQYSCDVFVGLLCIFLLPNIDITKPNRTTLLLLTFFIIILPFISLPSVFFIGSFFVINFIQNYKNKIFYKNLFLILIPFLILMVLYYIFNLLPEKISMDTAFPHYWDEAFIGLGKSNFVTVLATYIKVIFRPNSFILFKFILMLLGIYYLCKEHRTILKYILYVFVLAILASLLRIYPFAERVALYCAPIMIFLCIIPLDKVKLKSVSGIMVILMILLGFGGYNLNYTNLVTDKSIYTKSYPQKLMMKLQEKYNPQTDEIIINNASKASFILYSTLYNFNAKNITETPFATIQEYLNSLPKGKKYWFYLVKDYKKQPIYDIILTWAHDSQKILYIEHELQGFLILVEVIN